MTVKVVRVQVPPRVLIFCRIFLSNATVELNGVGLVSSQALSIKSPEPVFALDSFHFAQQIFDHCMLQKMVCRGSRRNVVLERATQFSLLRIAPACPVNG